MAISSIITLFSPSLQNYWGWGGGGGAAPPLATALSVHFGFVVNDYNTDTMQQREH